MKEELTLKGPYREFSIVYDLFGKSIAPVQQKKKKGGITSPTNIKFIKIPMMILSTVGHIKTIMHNLC